MDSLMYRDKDFLKSTFPWANDAVLTMLSEQGRVMLARSKQLLFEEGERVKGLFFVVSGTLKSCIHCNRPEERIVNLFSKSDLIGLRSLLNLEFYDKSLVTISDVEIIYIDRDTFLQVVMKSPSISMSVMKQLQNGINEMESRLTVIMQRPVHQRLANAVITLANKFGISGDSKINLEITPKELASLIITTRTTVYRIINQMERDGILSFRNNEIQLRDLPRLTDMAIPQKSQAS